MLIKKKPHKLSGKEIENLIAVQSKILAESKKRNIPMSKRKAKKLAIAFLGFQDTEDYNKFQKEMDHTNSFFAGVKTALPKFFKNLL